MLQNPNTDRQQQIESCYNEFYLEIQNNFLGIGITETFRVMLFI